MRQLDCSAYQQDNAPCQTRKPTKAWFVTNNIRVLELPGNCPDINPIENLWQSMKCKIDCKRCTSLNILRAEVTRVWCLETSPEGCANLVASMPRRLAAVLQNRGYPTKYYTVLTF